MPRILGFLLAVAALALMTSCTSDKPQDDSNRVSTIPWNRPEKWEGQGPMGGMMPGSM